MAQAAAAYLIKQHNKPIVSVVHDEAAFSDDLFARFIDYTDRKPTTVKAYVSCIRQFANWLQAEGIEQPTRDHIKQYRDHLAASDLKASTQAQYLRAVCHFFKWTAAEGIYPNVADNVHGAKVNRHKHHKQALSQEGMDEVPNKIDRTTEQGKRLYAMAMLCTRAGLRVVELHRANVGDLKTVGGVPYIYVQQKGHDAKDKPKKLNEAAEAVWDYLDARTEPLTPKSPLFTSTGNRCGTDANGKPTRRIAVTTISTMLKGALVDAGYDSDDLTPHSMRHGYATGLFKSGLNLYEVQMAMGHQDPATTEIYIHDDDEQTIEGKACEAIENYIHGRSTATILPDLEALIKAMSLDEQAALLADLKKGGE